MNTMKQTEPEESRNGTSPRSRRGEPTWEIATLFPVQGEWRESEYLALETNHLVELVDGCLEFLPMPTRFHQRILKFLLWQLEAFVAAHRLGEVLFSPLPLKLWEKQYREPDIVFLRSGRENADHPFLDYADLVMEIVSDGTENRKRDLIEKRDDYAKAKIAEYWIVDPQEKRIHVLNLDGDKYVEHGVFGAGEEATSVLLDGFSVKVTDVFAAAEQA